ncbi:MAG TPA: hypothetical protein VHX63_05055 [Acidobacteriaceae bacterium]|nr:hypothetical protein [Acidobacteriaceae bacterium]
MQLTKNITASSDSKHPWLSRWFAVLCVGLVVLSASLQVCHFHAPGNEGGPDHCSICIAIHSALPTTAHTVRAAMQAAPEYIAPSVISQYHRTAALHLPSRAPPVDTVLA